MSSRRRAHRIPGNEIANILDIRNGESGLGAPRPSHLALGAILKVVDREETPAVKERRYLLVRAGGSCCAVPASAVRRVVRNLPCHPFPGEQPYFVGFSQFGGEPLAVLDLHTLITGEAPRSHHGATVILGRGSRGRRTVIGLAVDEAVRVASISEPGETQNPGSMIEGTITLAGESVDVLDTSVLFKDQWVGTEARHG